MKITLAKTAGFCFGVDRAVKMVFELLEKGEGFEATVVTVYVWYPFAGLFVVVEVEH